MQQVISQKKRERKLQVKKNIQVYQMLFSKGFIHMKFLKMAGHPMHLMQEQKSEMHFQIKCLIFFSGLSGGSEENSWEKNRNEIPDNSSGNGFHMDGSAAQTAVNTGQTAENTAVIADALDITNEQLKYLRDIAERDTVNRFTTASIKVEMTNQNNINSGMDIDGVVNGLALAVSDAMSQAAEGVHI